MTYERMKEAVAEIDKLIKIKEKLLHIVGNGFYHISIDTNFDKGVEGFNDSRDEDKPFFNILSDAIKQLCANEISRIDQRIIELQNEDITKLKNTKGFLVPKGTIILEDLPEQKIKRIKELYHQQDYVFEKMHHNHFPFGGEKSSVKHFFLTLGEILYGE